MALLNSDMTDKIKDARHWRDRSAEIRARAAEMQDGASRRVMLSIAESYEAPGAAGGRKSPIDPTRPGRKTDNGFAPVMILAEGRERACRAPHVDGSQTST